MKGFSKDVRKIIWRKLHKYDKEFLLCAVNPKKIVIGSIGLLGYCAFCGYLDLLKLYLIPSYFPIVSKNAQCNVLEYIKEHGYVVTQNDFIDSILYGNLDVVKWYLKNGIVIEESYDFWTSFKSHNLHVLVWLVENGYVIDLIALHWFAEYYGEIEISDWIRGSHGKFIV